MLYGDGLIWPSPPTNDLCARLYWTRPRNQKSNHKNFHFLGDRRLDLRFQNYWKRISPCGRDSDKSRPIRYTSPPHCKTLPNPSSTVRTWYKLIQNSASKVQLIQSFPPIRVVIIPRLKNPVCQLFTHCWRRQQMYSYTT